MKRLIILFLKSTLIIMISVRLPLSAQTGKVLHSLKTPGGFCTGLTWDGKALWTADRKADKLYCLDPHSGRVVKTLESPGYFPTGLTWDGQWLWNADIRGRSDISENLDGMIFKIDPENGTILQTLKSPVPSPQGITWDGSALWAVDDTKKIVVRFSPEDGTTLNSFPSPASDPSGLTWDGSYLWISDRILDEFYMVDPATGYVMIIAPAPGPYMRDLAWDGNALWCVDFQDDRLYKLQIRGNETVLITDNRDHKLTYSHQTKVFGPGRLLELDVYLALPEDRVNQKIEKIEFSPDPTGLVTDQWGQKAAHYHFSNLESSRLDLEYTVEFQTRAVRFFLYPENMGKLSDIPNEIRDRYLADDEKYQLSHPVIRNTIREVVGDEANPYWILRKIHQYLITHLEYRMDGYWDTAPTVIRNGHGSCSEYTFTFIALCRAAGLPARYVGSVWRRKDDAVMDNVFHRWAEVYLPGTGWVPTDPTHGDRISPRDQAYPIGLIQNDALITTESGGDSETLGWTYNSNEFYKTEPKTNINIEHFGDWLPADTSQTDRPSKSSRSGSGTSGQ
jgi:transglutaminase-like putative cysteine protease/outer membrane protein assembly factor BamB